MNVPALSSAAKRALMKAWCALILLLVLGIATSANSTAAVTKFEYPAPDGSADVHIDQPDPHSCEIEIRFSERSRTISTLSFASEDHEHGSCLGAAAWTTDSRYFAFSIVSSGGHQPWHSPIMIYFREAERTKPLENFLKNPKTEAVTDPNFALSSDVIKFTTTGLGPAFDHNPQRHRSLDLSRLHP